jgi:carboxymethylenebutenolidase
MSENVSFPSNGDTAGGYLALPASGSGPGLLVVQEWWGLNDQIRNVADQLAAEGFVALAPDLYHGELAQHDEMDKANHLMSTLDQERAARDMGAAVDYLLSRDEVSGDALGVIGFCMGGMISFLIAAAEGDRIAAITPWYGAPLGDDAPDLSALTASVRGHFASDDAFFTADAVRDLETKLKAMGKDVSFVFHEGTGHAFGNEENGLGTYDPDAKAAAWSDSIAFLKSHVPA